MEFCPKCKSMMFLSEGKLKCRNQNCGYEKERPAASAKPAPTPRVRRRKVKDITIIDEKVDTLPITQARCPSCGNGKAYWWLRQMRGGDEPETRFFRCIECGKTWRGNA